MLNRRHIRIKVMQSLYAYWSTGGGIQIKETVADLEKNMKRLHELYLYLLLFLCEFLDFVEKYDDEVRAVHIPSSFDLNMNEKLYKNAIGNVLKSSKFLQEALKKNKLIWNPEDNILLRKAFLDLKSSETYTDYIHSSQPKESDDSDIYAFILKNYTDNFSLVEQHLEDKFISWYDDSRIAVQMAIRTIKQIDTSVEDQDFILPLTADETESFDFAFKLLNISLERGDEFDVMIRKRIDKWEPSRIPLVDVIILKMSMAEFCDFPSIPTKVTFNEYVEIAKNYSTPNSRKFINGILDNLLADLNAEGKVVKSGLGLL
jgi:transcription antitermination protein NusB